MRSRASAKQSIFVTLPLHERRRAAFTLVEVLVSLGLLTMIAGATTWGLSQINFSATSNRVYTNAQTVAQNQIDAFLSAGPYSPRHIVDDPYPLPSPRPLVPLIPPELVTGTTIYDYPPPDGAGPGVLIYTDPASGMTIYGKMTRVVEDLGMTQTTNGKTDSLDVRRLTVTIEYTFKGKAFTVAAGRAIELSTVRTSDFER